MDILYVSVDPERSDALKKTGHRTIDKVHIKLKIDFLYK